MSDAPRIAVVIVHFGDPAPTRRCLDALPRVPALAEVILVDQPPRLFGEHPRVTTRLETDSNLGFAAACNLAVAAATSPFVLLLNNDATLDDAAAEALTAATATLPDDAAGACLKLLSMDDATIQSAGGLWFTRDGIGFPNGFGETDRGQYDTLTGNRIGVPSGAAALYRTSAWREAGGMAEEFFCYCEDGDLGLRMVAAGHRFAWFPKVRVRHELSSSSGAHSRFKAFHVERNHFAAMVHGAPVATLAALPLLTLHRLFRTAGDAARGRGAGAGLVGETSLLGLAKTLAEAWWGALLLMPNAIRRRRRLVTAFPQGPARIGRFLATRRATLDDFSRPRHAPPGKNVPLHDSHPVE